MRVIAGELGGRRLAAPRGSLTRPTSERVREALFSALGDLTGALVLDLYAGSGALAIEALSRGASHAVAVEKAPPALRALGQNVARLGLTARLHVVPLAVERAAARVCAYAESLGPFDLVLVDPPYAEVPSGSFARVLGRYRVAFTEDARLVLEHAARDRAPDLSPLWHERTRRYGDTAVSCYRAGGEPAAVPR
jgi:16S rRNA (guanine966-N2)-methyltransferase